MRIYSSRFNPKKQYVNTYRSLAFGVLIAVVGINSNAVANDSEPRSVGSTIIPASELVEKLIPITGDEGLIAERKVDLDIRFALGSAELDKTSKAQVEALAKALASSELSAAEIKVYGHTDATGSAELNQTLSESRAASVVAAILELAEISPSRIESAGFGETQLKDPENPQSGMNRRVEIVAVYRTTIDEDIVEPKKSTEAGEAGEATEATEATKAVEILNVIEVIEVAPEEGVMVIE